jgi:hypothetical protein
VGSIERLRRAWESVCPRRICSRVRLASPLRGRAQGACTPGMRVELAPPLHGLYGGSQIHTREYLSHLCGSCAPENTNSMHNHVFVVGSISFKILVANPRGGKSPLRPHPSPLHCVEREQPPPLRRYEESSPPVSFMRKSNAGDHKGPPRHSSPPSPLRIYAPVRTETLIVVPIHMVCTDGVFAAPSRVAS